MGTKITVTYKRLQSYGHYSNVELGGTIEFEILPGPTGASAKRTTEANMADLRQIVDAQVEAELDRVDPHGYWPWKQQAQEPESVPFDTGDDDDEEMAPKCFRHPETCASPDEEAERCSFWSECRIDSNHRTCFNDQEGPVDPCATAGGPCPELDACHAAHEARVAGRGSRS